MIHVTNYDLSGNDVPLLRAMSARFIKIQRMTFSNQNVMRFNHKTHTLKQLDNNDFSLQKKEGYYGSGGGDNSSDDGGVMP